MRLDDDFDEDDDYESHINYKNSTSIFTAVIAISVVFLLVLLLVLSVNNKNEGNKKTNNNRKVEENITSSKDTDELISGSKLRAEDLDFWDDYPKEVKPEVSVDAVTPDPMESIDNDPSTDGKHFKIEYDDGSEEWVLINTFLDRNDYNYSNLVYKKPFLRYYSNNHLSSFVGVDVSKIDDYIDYNALKNAGVDFVMIKLGQRGYYSGEISLDDNFLDNYQRAKQAGLKVGVYFFTAAISHEEAKEEAEFVINTISENGVDYPVVYYNETINDSEIRSDALSQMQRTNIAMTFMDTIKDAGYYPMLYGNEEWLVKKYSIGSLTNYDVWLSDISDIPDYPYKFQMWRYSTTGNISGIAGYANVNICFIDYSVK